MAAVEQGRDLVPGGRQAARLDLDQEVGPYQVDDEAVDRDFDPVAWEARTSA